MLRTCLAAAALLAAAPDLPACTFCAGPLRSAQTLRMKHARARVVLYGDLKNPRFDPATDRGLTDFHARAVLKDDPARGGRTQLTLPQYLPVVGDTPPDFVLFCDVVNGRLEAVHGGVPAPAAVVEYLKAAARADDADPVARLGFFFRHLDSPDPTVAGDAFLEFARTPDADIVRARAGYDPGRLRKWIADPATPAERLGVLTFLLGVCGGPDDAAFLARLLAPNPLPERSSAAVGGLLAGYILLDPKAGWAFAAGLLADPKRPYSERLSAIGTVRFFQGARPDFRPQVLHCCAALLPHGDLADQAVEDLRRWGWWDLTADVLAQFPKPTHAAPIVRRGIVRYALTCPRPEAKAFADALRKADPKLVESVEEQLSLYDPVRPGEKKE